MVSTKITQGVPSSPVAPTGEEGTPCEFLICYIIIFDIIQ
jgi:hypothetical protein